MYPKRNYKELYSFPEVWKAIFQLILGGGGSGGGSHKKGIGDSETQELQDILHGIVERQFYPKSFPKVWRALKYINERYNSDDSSDDSSDDNSGGNEQLKKSVKETKIQEEP